MKKAFTMIEMLIVMSVILIIFLISLPNIQTTMGVVSNKGCDAQLKLVDAAILQYVLQYDKNPGSMADLVAGGFISERQVRCSDNSEIHIINGQASR